MLWANHKLRLIVSNECNLDCFYCHNEGQPKSSDLLSQNLFSHILRIVDLRHCGLERVTFSGGEPLLHPQLEHFVRELASTVQFRTVVTNGLLLDECRLDSLRTAGVTKFRVGVDSIVRPRSRPSKSFPNGRTIHETLKLLERTATPFELNVVLTDFNRNEVPEILRFCRDHKVSAKFFEHVKTSFCQSEFATLNARSDPRLEFSGFGHILQSVLPNAVHAASDVFDGANEIFQCEDFSVRYCRYLCPYGLCFLTGTRIDPRGFVYACLVGNGRFRIRSDQSVSESASIISEALDWGCSSAIGAAVSRESIWKEVCT